MPTIAIQCPYHGQTESIELPEGYFNFEGEIKCGETKAARVPGGQQQAGPFTLKIKLYGGDVVEVARALNP